MRPRVQISDTVLAGCRHALAMHGVEVTLEQLKAILEHTACIADVLAMEKVVLGLRESLDLRVDAKAGMVQVVHYTGE